MHFIIHSSEFVDRGHIPNQYTCEGANVSPPLAWGGAPDGTKTFALIVDDPDAPDPAAPQRIWVHWVLYDIPASVKELPEDSNERLPNGVRVGRNDWGNAAYGGPCPPIGRHRYFFKLYALDQELGDLKTPTAAALHVAMEGHILSQTTIIGTYQKEQQTG